MESVAEIQLCEDPVTKVFFGKLGYRIVYLWVICNIVFFLTSMHYGTLTKIELSPEMPVSPDTLPLLKDKSFYLFFVTGICGILLIDRILKKGSGTFSGLWKNRVLRAKTGMKNPAEEYNRQLRDLENKVNSKKSYIYASFYVLFSISYTIVDYYRIPLKESPLIVFCDIRLFPWNGAVVYATYALLYFLLSIVIYKSVLLIRFLRKLHKTFDFHVNPLHKDRCGGLRPVGSFCVSINYIVFIFFITFIIFYNFPQIGEQNLSFYVTLPLYLFLAIFFFVYPIWPIHSSMKAQEQDFFDELVQNLDSEYEEVRDQMHKVPRWPVETGEIIWLLAAFIVPVISVAAAAFSVSQLIIASFAVFFPLMYVIINILPKSI